MLLLLPYEEPVLGRSFLRSTAAILWRIAHVHRSFRDWFQAVSVLQSSSSLFQFFHFPPIALLPSEGPSRLDTCVCQTGQPIRVEISEPANPSGTTSVPGPFLFFMGCVFMLKLLSVILKSKKVRNGVPSDSQSWIRLGDRKECWVATASDCKRNAVRTCSQGQSVVVLSSS